MAQDKQGSFWLTLPGMLTGAAAVVTAVTGLILALNQVGIFSEDEPAGVSATAASQTADEIAGRWIGTAASAGEDVFEISLDVSIGCTVGARCGTIAVSSVPCEGEITLESVSGEDYEFSVDNFSSDSGPTCTPGAGEIFRQSGADTLSYRTTYAPITGTLRREP